MKEIVDFIFETGILKRIQRTGYYFLGTGKDTVAEHSMRCAVIGYVLSKMDEAVDELKVVEMCLFHDLPEARIGDLNYVNKKYVEADEAKAVRDMASRLPFGDELTALLGEFDACETKEAVLANDADHLEMIFQLKELKDVGNANAHEWLTFAVKRLRTEHARAIAEETLGTEYSHWWFNDKSDWWVKAGRGK